MKNFGIILFIAFGFVLSSCSEEGTNAENQIGTEANIYDIEIENNQKWVVIEDMMVYIHNMDNDIQSTGNAETLDLDGLGEKLDANIELLTSNCTMSGKAHDELHKWLVPFIGLVTEMNEASTYDDKQAAFESIEESMVEFNAYFE